MTGLRFSLRSLAGAVTVIALACAILVNGSAYCVALLGLTILAIHLTALIGIAYRREAARAFWCGFAIFGWAYLLSVFGADPWRPKFIDAEGVLRQLYPYVHREIPITNTAEPWIREFGGRNASGTRTAVI